MSLYGEENARTKDGDGAEDAIAVDLVIRRDRIRVACHLTLVIYF